MTAKEHTLKLMMDYRLRPRDFDTNITDDIESRFQQAIDAALAEQRDHRLESYIEDRVQTAVERCAEIVDKHWTFDNNQQHTHTWHCKQDCLQAILEGDRA